MTIVIQYIHQMTARTDLAILMVNMLLLDLYYSIARVGLGIMGIGFDLKIPRTRCASRCEDNRNPT